MTERASLLVFTLSPTGECARRRLLPSRFSHLEQALHRHNLDAALSAGRASGCRLEVSSPQPLPLAADVRFARQRGRDFGERFRTALSASFGRSEGPVVAVGSDVPGLTGGHVERALDRLGDDPRRVVVGPSPDGGFYLLASHRPLDAELDRVRWCSRDTLRTLLAALRERGLEVSLLEPLRDLDRPTDLLAWLAGEALVSPRWRRAAARLLRTLSEWSRPAAPARAGRTDAGYVYSLASRGPPR